MKQIIFILNKLDCLVVLLCFDDPKYDQPHDDKNNYGNDD